MIAIIIETETGIWPHYTLITNMERCAVMAARFASGKWCEARCSVATAIGSCLSDSSAVSAAACSSCGAERERERADGGWRCNHEKSEGVESQGSKMRTNKSGERIKGKETKNAAWLLYF